MDQVQLNFNSTTLLILNVVLAFILFGVAIDLKWSDFKRIKSMPKEILVGLSGQLFLLPALTVLLIILFQPTPSIALGMILVASCPGGNLSNFLTHFAKGNAALSVTLTTLATILATVVTPINFYFWGNRLPDTKNLLQTIEIPFASMILQTILLIGIPLILGLFIAHQFPKLAKQVKKPMKYFSLLFFFVFIVLALRNNWEYFLEYIDVIFFIVLVHNALAFTIGYCWSTLFRIEGANRKAITLEVGLQNSGLGLILIFNFFNGLGGMAIIAAFWGIWHIISGFTLSYYFKKFAK